MSVKKIDLGNCVDGAVMFSSYVRRVFETYVNTHVPPDKMNFTKS